MLGEARASMSGRKNKIAYFYDRALGALRRSRWPSRAPVALHSVVSF